MGRGGDRFWLAETWTTLVGHVVGLKAHGFASWLSSTARVARNRCHAKPKMARNYYGSRQFWPISGVCVAMTSCDPPLPSQIVLYVDLISQAANLLNTSLFLYSRFQDDRE